MKKSLYLKFIVIIFFSILLIPAKASEFDLTTTRASIGVNCTSRIDIEIDPDSIESNAADIEITYDPTELSIIDENPNASGVQIGTGNAYEYYYGNEISSGTIRLTGGSLNSTLETKSLFGFIRYTALKTGNATLSISFTPQSTLDSNIARYSDSKDTLTTVKNLSLNVINQVCSDTEGPVITFLYPRPYDTISSKTPEIQIDILDTLTDVDIDSLEIHVNDKTYTSTSGEVTCQKITNSHYICSIKNTSEFEEGQTINVIVRVKDQFGNQSESYLTFYIQKTKIEPEPTSPSSPLKNVNIRKAVDILDTQVVGVDTPTFTSAIVLTTVGISFISLLLQIRSIQLVFSLLGVLLSRKRSHPWGLVYEFSTFKPIPFAVVRLYNMQGVMVYQKVTDLRGRYGFPINKGNYTLEVDHSDYAKQKFEIKITKDSMINIDVQMLPKTKQTQLFILYEAVKIITKIVSKLRNFFILFGFAFSAYAMLVDQNIINIIIFSLYVIVGIINLIFLINKPRELSKLINSYTKKNLSSRALVKIFDREKWTLVDTQISSNDGKFGFTLDAGVYALLVSAKGYNFPSKYTDSSAIIKEKLQSLMEIRLKKNRSLKEKILLDPVSGATIDTGFVNPFA